MLWTRLDLENCSQKRWEISAGLHMTAASSRLKPVNFICYVLHTTRPGKNQAIFIFRSSLQVSSQRLVSIFSDNSDNYLSLSIFVGQIRPKFASIIELLPRDSIEVPGGGGGGRRGKKAESQTPASQKKKFRLVPQVLYATLNQSVTGWHPSTYMFLLRSTN